VSWQPLVHLQNPNRPTPGATSLCDIKADQIGIILSEKTSSLLDAKALSLCMSASLVPMPSCQRSTLSTLTEVLMSFASIHQRWTLFSLILAFELLAP
jgi:hypothetical protein